MAAKDSIDDLTWGSYTGYRTEEEQKAYLHYVDTMNVVCAKGTVEYREVSSLSDEHYYKRSTDLLKYYSYHLGYFDISNINVPLISYVVIDSTEVILGFSRVPGRTRPLEGVIYLSIREPSIVRFFKDYYESIWIASTKLKEADRCNNAKLQEISSILHIASD